MSDRRWILSALLLLTCAACELIVDFDEGPETGGMQPVPIPQYDGSMPVIVDAQAISDGTVVRPPNDAGDAGEAGDAGDAGDAAVFLPDAALDAGQDAAVGDIDAALDAGNDAGSDGEVLDATADAELSDASDADTSAAAHDAAEGDGAVGDAS